MKITDKYVIKIYKNDVFAGYVKSNRLSRNGEYRFTRTKNINECISTESYFTILGVFNKVSILGDKIYNRNCEFRILKITEQEMRNSKLSVLKNKVIREGIFKNRKTL